MIEELIGMFNQFMEDLVKNIMWNRFSPYLRYCELFGLPREKRGENKLQHWFCA